MQKLLIFLSLSIFGQPWVQKNWSPVGAGNTASRPAKCTALKHVYINTQTNALNYCTATDTWTAFGGGAGTVTSVDATGGVETDSGSAITASGTVRGGIVVNAQTGTTYTVLTGDRGKLVTHTNGSAIAVTLPQAGGSFPANWYYMAQNRGAGTATITPTTSTIDGAASLALLTGQGAVIVSDGTNYFTMRGLGTATGLGDPGSNGIVYRNGSGTSTVASATEMAGPLYCADAGANDTYACSLSPVPSAYTTGASYIFKANTANTGAATINFNSLGAKTIKKVAGGITTDLSDNDIRSGQFVELTYDGTNMQMQSLLGNAPGAGGGSSLTYGAYASLPATCTTGDRYLTSDSLYEFACTATNTWTAFHEGKLAAIPPSSGWSWVNQGSATITDTAGVLYLLAPAAAGDSVKIRTRTMPGGTWTLEARIATWATDNNFNRSGIGFRESATGKLVAGIIDEGKNCGYIKYTNPTTFSSNGAYSLYRSRQWFDFKLTYDGTTITIACSLDMGMHWVEKLSEAKATFFTTAPDEIFFFADANNGSNAAATTLVSWRTY